MSELLADCCVLATLDFFNLGAKLEPMVFLKFLILLTLPLLEKDVARTIDEERNCRLSNRAASLASACVTVCRNLSVDTVKVSHAYQRHVDL